ncbi:MAG: hypothetical protein AAGJ46_08850 [Planctomycetota bacterium]
MELSIQQLFSQLTVRQLVTYLTNDGWVEKESRHPARRRYELEDGESTYVMVLPLSDTETGMVDLVQNAVRNLSCIVDRQPRELVKEMLVLPAATPPSTTTAGRYRVRVKKAGAGALAVREDATGRVNTLHEGEAIEIICHVDENGVLEMEIEGSSLRLLAPQG